MNRMKEFIKKIVRWVRIKLKRPQVAVSKFILRLHSWILDIRICGKGLGGIVEDKCGDEKDQIGGTRTESSYYIYLRRIFSHVYLTASDRILDVGCGKGRVLAFLIKENCPCEINGVEYNEQVAKIAEAWTAKYPQVNVITGDAFLQNFNKYTVLTLSRPFLVHTYCAFIQKLEETLTHPITVVSWYEDSRVFEYIINRSGWRMVYHENTNRIHRLYLGPRVLPFTIWEYDPEKRKMQ